MPYLHTCPQIVGTHQLVLITQQIPHKIGVDEMVVIATAIKAEGRELVDVNIELSIEL